MRIGIVGGGINGLCSAWVLAQKGHTVTLYERDKLMRATSCASSKLLHGGLRYLENGEFRLVREALRERDAWIRRVPQLAKPLRLVMPIYKNSRRSRALVGAGMFLYDNLAGRSDLPKAKWLTAAQLLARDPQLKSEGLRGGYEFSDGQMDDYQLGLWVADQARSAGVQIREQQAVQAVNAQGVITLNDGRTEEFDQLINIAGPWANQLLEQSGISSPYKLDLVRGSHLVLSQPCAQAYLLEVPGERRIFFVLPWKGKTLLGTTEVRQTVEEPITCSQTEADYLLAAFRHYQPGAPAPVVQEQFAGVRPLLYSAADPSRATREYAFDRQGKLLTVLGGKWTTTMALSEKVSQNITRA